MANKVCPEVRVLFYNAGAVVRPQRHATTLVHDYGDMVKKGKDSTSLVPDRDVMASGNFNGVFRFDSVSDHLDFVRFTKDGRVLFGTSAQEPLSGSVAGWILKARDAWMDARIQGDSTNTDKFDQTWVGTLGTWKSTIPRVMPVRTAIMNSGTDLTSRAEAVGSISANRGMVFDITCLGRLESVNSQSTEPAIRVEMPGKTYSVVLRHNQTPCLDKGNIGNWETALRLMDAPKCNLFTGSYRVSIRRINGMVVVGINDQFWYLTEATTAIRQDTTAEARESSWLDGKLAVTVYAVRVTVSTAMVKYATSADDPYSGALAASQTFVSQPGNTITPKVHGTIPNGADLTATGTATGNTVAYTATLTANSEGIDTPFLMRTTSHQAAEWTVATSPAYIDVSGAVLSVTNSAAMPPLMAGNEATIELDRVLLTKLAPTWATVIQDYAKVEIMARWRLDDGTYDPPGGDWYGFIQGYVQSRSASTSAPLNAPFTVKVRDSIFRLQGENARIDGRYPPLDQHFLSAGGGDWYGWQGVKEILKLALGPTVAASLYHYLPACALISTTGSRGPGLLSVQAAAASIGGTPATQQGWQFPPPFGEDAISWINKIAEDDRAVFFYGSGPPYTTGLAGQWPIPVYGRLSQILAGMGTVNIPDADYVSGDANKLLQSATNETRPDRNINRVLTWGSAPQNGALAQISPSLFQGEARVSTTDANRPELSWERTLIVRDSILNWPGTAQGVANAIIAEIEGVAARFPVITTRGIGAIGWGNKVTFDMFDTNLGLTGHTWRIERLTDTINMQGPVPDWTTQMYIRPLTTSGF